MIKVSKAHAQGDVMFIRLTPKVIREMGLTIPEQRVPVKEHVVAHSETGHHHILRGGEGLAICEDPNDALQCFLFLDEGMFSGGGAPTITHHRSYDTHEAIELTKPGTWLVRRQREPAIEGWRQVQD